MGRADIGKDIARASLCLHLNNKTLHVRPPVTPPRQRALTLPEPRLSRLFPQLLLSRNVASIREPTRSNSRILAGNFSGNGDSFGLGLVTRVSQFQTRRNSFSSPHSLPPLQLGISRFISFFLSLFIYLFIRGWKLNLGMKKILPCFSAYGLK